MIHQSFIKVNHYCNRTLNVGYSQIKLPCSASLMLSLRSSIITVSTFGMAAFSSYISPSSSSSNIFLNPILALLRCSSILSCFLSVIHDKNCACLSAFFFDLLASSWLIFLTELNKLLSVMFSGTSWSVTDQTYLFLLKTTNSMVQLTHIPPSALLDNR